MIAHNHSDLCTCGSLHINKLSQATIKKIDPTRMTALRNAFVGQMDKRFNELARVITKAVVEQDCFVLKPKPNPIIYQMTLPGKEAFAFRTSQEKIQEFMSWLQEQVDKGILTKVEYQQLGAALQQEWSDLYIEDSYKRGVIRARYEMIKAGWNIPSIEASGGIMAVMAMPFHMDRLGILFSRTYTDLKGVTSAMDAQMSRILAQGMADGDGPILIARKLVSVINGDTTGTLGMTDTLGRFIPAKRRAELVARTEMQRAHHMAMIQEYRNWGIAGVHVMAEWVTAGDDRVCSECSKMEGKRFTLDEIEPMIPLHPQCRCIAIPAGPEYDLSENK